jgi:hypothetical protein
VYAPTWRKESRALASSDASELQDARAEVLAAGDAFRRSAGPAISAALRARLEDLVASEPDWYARMTDEVRAAFRDATERAIAHGAAETDARLTEDVWLNPLIAPGIDRSPAPGWDANIPDWLVGILRALSGKKQPEHLGGLDDVANRAWVVLLAAAKPLDPVLERFGLVPSDVPDLGGGNFGLSPRNAYELDPSASLRSLWDRYRAAYERYRSMTRAEAPGTRRRR